MKLHPGLVSLLGWLRRYFPLTTLLALAALVYIFYLSETSVVRSVELERTLDSLELVFNANRDTMEYYRTLNERLCSDPATMEQVVRENYNMVRDGEDVFIFE